MKAAGLLLLFFVTTVSAQSSLPECRGTDVSRWTNCQGTYAFVSGVKVGGFRDGKHHGQGTYPLTHGDKYVGEFRDGKHHGQGTYTSVVGHIYVGEFRDDKRHGQGTYTYVNGNKYVGEYRDGKRNGQGTYTFADGRPPQEGIWADDKFVRAERIPDYYSGRTSTSPLAQTLPAAQPVHACDHFWDLRNTAFERGDRRGVKNTPRNIALVWTRILSN